MLSLVAGEVLLGREASASGLWASLMAAEEGLGVALVVLAKVASAGEDSLGGAAREGAGPGAVLVKVAVSTEVRSVGRGRARQAVVALRSGWHAAGGGHGAGNGARCGAAASADDAEAPLRGVGAQWEAVGNADARSEGRGTRRARLDS